MRLPILAALVLLLAPVPTAAIPPPIKDPNAPEPVLLNYRPWGTFTLPRAGVVVDLPIEPTLEVGGLYRIQGSGFMISVSVSQLPSALTPEQLRETSETSANQAGNRLLSTKSFVQDGVAGVETRAVSPQGQLISHSTYVHKTWLYQVVFLVGEGGTLSPYAERMRTSLRFLDAPEPYIAPVDFGRVPLGSRR